MLVGRERQLSGCIIDSVSSSKSIPFFPRDKPRTWIIGVCAGLSGMTIGLVGLAFGLLGIRSIQLAALPLFGMCWTVFALSWIVFAFRLMTGNYKNLEAKDWNEQVW